MKKNVREITDQYAVCGMRGYDYSNLGLDSEKIIRTSNNFAQLIKKTEARRCDLFVARLEILLGFEEMGVLKLPHSLQHSHVPGAEPDHFHMLVSRAIPDSEDVYRIINTGLQSLKDSGALEELVGKHEKERRSSLHGQ